MCDFLEIKLVYIEEVPLLVGGVGLQEGAVAVLGRAVQIVITFNQFHELLLDIGKLALWEFVLVRLDL